MRITARHLDKYYNKGKSNEIHVINDISLELPETGITAIFGKSGCGKTTLLNVFGGLDRADGGEIEIDGSRFSGGDDYIRNRMIGYIFQNYNLSYEKSVFDNVADVLRLCGVKDEKIISDRVLTALSNVGMEKYRKRYPGNLSGGQQQRVAIARAIVKSPKIILADEPTGNLDEANTVMVMDMLKRISETCLVVLVTHEEKLEDYYCETVIRLSDGQVTDVRKNGSVEGYSHRSKNDVFLGEYDEHDEGTERISLKYYGEKPGAPIGLRIVNTGDRIFLKVDAPNVTVIDDTNEIRLREGKFEENAANRSVTAAGEYVELPELPEAKKSDYGKLYSFFGSIRKRVSSSFGTAKKKKGKAFLRACMALLAGVAVLLTAIYGKKLSAVSENASSFNDRVFYVGEEIEGAGEKLYAAVGDSGSGIDYIYYSNRPYYALVEGDAILTRPDYFVTDETSVSLETSAVTLPFSLGRQTPVSAGEKTEDADCEWITRPVADDLLKQSRVGYLKNYEDLIGLVNGSHGRKIAAVLDTNERAVYVPEDYLIDINAVRSGLRIVKGETPDGAIILNRIPERIYAGSDPTVSTSEGDKLKISGREFVVSEIRDLYGSYEDYLRGEHKDVYDLVSGVFQLAETGAFYEKLASDASFAASLGINDGGSGAARLAEKYPFAVFDYAYGYFEDWVEYCVKNGVRGTSFDAISADSVYRKSGFADARFVAYGDGFSVRYYYYLVKFRAAYGIDPGAANFAEKYSDSSYPRLYTLRSDDFYLSLGSWAGFDALSEDVMNYSNSLGNVSPGNISDYFFTVSESDYLYVCSVNGETSDLVDDGTWKYGNDKAYRYYYEPVYYLVHATNVKAAEKYLSETFGAEYGKSGQEGDNVISPDMTLEYLKLVKNLDVVGGIVPFIVILVLLALCVYFMIRSGLMSRVREVGIYRAIGVSKRNLRFEFMTETAMLAFTSILPGFLLASAGIFYVIGRTSYASRVLYYPVWLAALMFVFLAAVCLICGLLPINRLLRKTPAEILSKYDI